ncbi:MAG TPA: phosphatidylserine decarboxylase [Fimbriimonadaceae bacterium]|nr:phosphatidylserine decarboxylase [Fimbriimonadaceae bacterium]
MIVFLSILAGLALGFLAFVWWMRNVWFHRDPDHTKTDQEHLLLRSPVYGRVAYIRQVQGGKVVSEKLGEEIPISDITKEEWPAEHPDGNGWLIGIAMTALDVHFQYAPLPGKIGRVTHIQHGRNLPMFDFWEYVRITYVRRAVQLWARKYVFENERQTMWIDGERARVALVLIADKFINKITTFVQQGQAVPSGGKLSFIGRGSQVDVVVCGQPNIEFLVKEGDAVYGPSTVLAKLHE